MELEKLIELASANGFVKQFKAQLCPECNLYKEVHAYAQKSPLNIWYLCNDCRIKFTHDHFRQLSVKEEFVIKSLC